MFLCIYDANYYMRPETVSESSRNALFGTRESVGSHDTKARACEPRNTASRWFICTQYMYNNQKRCMN